MNLEEAQDLILSWSVNAPRFERMDFLKRFLENLTCSELKGAKKLCVRSAGRRRRKERLSELDAESLAEEEVGSDVAVNPGSTSENPASFPIEPTIPWWKQNGKKKNDFVAMDVEMVHKQIGWKGTRRKCVKEAATVAIVNYKGEVIYYRTVRHARGSFITNKYTKQINGFQPDSFVNGDDTLENIREEVIKIIQDKVVVTLAGQNDFEALGIFPICDFDTFDLQDHWYYETENDFGRIVKEPMGLKTIYTMYFPDESFQQGIHCPKEDAKATMKLFMDIYVRIKTEDVNLKTNFYPFDKLIK